MQTERDWDGILIVIAAVILVGWQAFGEDLRTGGQRIFAATAPAAASQEPEPQPEIRRLVWVIPAESTGCRPVRRCH